MVSVGKVSIGLGDADWPVNRQQIGIEADPDKFGMGHTRRVLSDEVTALFALTHGNKR